MPSIISAIILATSGAAPPSIRLPEPVTGPQMVCVFMLTEPVQFVCVKIEVRK